MKLGLKPSKFDGTELVYSVKREIAIPIQYSYKNALPPIQDQGQRNTCVPHSISVHLNWNYNSDMRMPANIDNRISIEDIYQWRSDKGDNGMTFKEALSGIYHHGAISSKGKLNIRQYAKINSMLGLKYAIIANGPCIAGLRVYNYGNEFWKPCYGDSLIGLHAISIVGYDATGFIIRNSWGRSWGSAGYGKLRYDDFSSAVVECWTLID